VLFDSELGIDVPVHRRGLGHVFQEGRLFPHLSVRQNLLYGRKAGGIRATHPTLEEVLALLDLEGLLQRLPRALSGGERQRVALGRALLAGPKGLLMDEPLAALDPARRREILPYLERLAGEAGVPILYVSHAHEEVARIAETTILLDAGRVTAIGPTQEIVARADPGAGVRDGGAYAVSSLARAVSHSS
jgi:molybdate transport system ATP-binding protein